MTIQEKLKKLETIPELELTQEFKEMFKLAFENSLPTSIGDQMAISDSLNWLMLSLGKSSSIYCKFLNLVEEQPLHQMAESIKIEYLYNFNLSVAETLKHLVNLTIYSKYNNQDIHNGYITLCNGYLVPEYATESHQIQTIMQFARFLNVQSQIYNNPEVNLRPAIYIQAENDFDIPTSEIFLKAGKIINHSFLIVYQNLIFNIMIGANDLSKSLLLGEMEKDNKVYGEKVLALWLYVFNLFDALGHDWDSIQRIYSVIYEKPNTNETQPS